MMMMTTTALITIATAHAFVVLTVSHGLLFRQPRYLRRHWCRCFCSPIFTNINPPATPPAPAALPAVSQTYRQARDQNISARAAPMKLRGSESGDPVCRPIRLSLSSFRFFCLAFAADLLKQALQAMLRAFRATRHPSSRVDSVAAS
jgi:hypothetical protein